MATAPPSLLTELEEELECSMCLETLKDPRVFPQCQHSFCYGCIVNLSLGNSKIFCPECRAEVEVGIPPDLSHFKRNTRINNILECITKLTCNDGTPHLNAEESVTKTSADLQQQPKDALQIDDRNNPPSVPQTSKNIAEREPVDSFTSTNLQHMTSVSLQIGSMVEVISKNKEPKYGVIRWIGYTPNSDKKVAGLELEEELDACSDGIFLGKRYFTCPNKRGFFVYLHNCVLDLRNCEENTANTRLTKPGRIQYKGQGHNEKRHLERSRGAIGTSFDEKWKESKNENQSKLKLCKDNLLDNQKKTSREVQKDALFSSAFYILLKDEWAKKQGTGYVYSSSGTKCLLKGEIMIRNLTTVVDSTNETLRLHPFDKTSYFCDCSIEDIEPLEDEKAKLLLSFKSHGERYKFYMNSTVDTGKKMTVGSNVYVKVRLPRGGTQELRGIIRYRGPLPKEDGTMFGVELLKGRGRGTTDGLFRGKRYFQCDPECGIFVSLEKLRLCETTEEGMLTKVKNKIIESISSLISPEQPDQENSSEEQKNTAGHQVGDRVWVYVGEKLCGGFIRYIGRVPGGRGLHVGIELDHPYGLGDGECCGKQLFECRLDHAYFTPIDNVISKEKLTELYGQAKDFNVVSCSAFKDNPSSEATHIQRFEDNGQTQPTFSKQSPDEAIKGQRYNEKQHLEKSRGAIGTSFDEKWKESKNENQSKLKLCKDNPLENQKKTSRKDQKDALFSSTFYILLKDEWAKKQGKDYGYSSSGTKSLLKGEIMIRNLTTVVDSTNETLRLHPYDKTSYFCDCSIEDIEPLEDEKAKLLLSFKSHGERYKFFMNSTVDTGKKMTIGSNVYVKVRLHSGRGGIRELRGIIRYKGLLPEVDGTVFGVELLKGRGRGTTDGIFRGQRYFLCDSECGIFVSLEKLRLCETTKESMLVKVKNKSVEGISSLIAPEETDQENSLEKQKNTAGHQVGDRVWVYVNDKFCGGFIRYIGRVPGGKDILVGIELDNPDGLGDGVYYGKQLFSCPLDHAHFNVIDNVISREKFHELYGK